MKILCVLALVAIVSMGIDVQKQLEYEHAFNYIIDIVSSNRVEDFDQKNLKRCTQSKCCICGKQFKNTTYSSIHIALHHHQSIKQPQQIAILFDEHVPPQQKYQFCQQYLIDYNLTVSQKEDVCLIVSEQYYKPKIWIEVVKYILYIALAILFLVYYSDISKGK